MANQKMSADEFDNWVTQIERLARAARAKQIDHFLAPGIEEFLRGLAKLKTQIEKEFGRNFRIDFVVNSAEGRIRMKTRDSKILEKKRGRPSLDPELAEVVLRGLERARGDGKMLRNIHQTLRRGGDMDEFYGRDMPEFYDVFGLPSIPRKIADNENWAQELRRICWRSVLKFRTGALSRKLSLAQINLMKKKYFEELQDRPIEAVPLEALPGSDPEE